LPELLPAAKNESARARNLEARIRQDALAAGQIGGSRSKHDNQGEYPQALASMNGLSHANL
jgi:hypothetical protein